MEIEKMGEGSEENEDYDSDGCSSLTSSAFGEELPPDSSLDDNLISISDILDFFYKKTTRKKRVDLKKKIPNLRAFVQKAQIIVKNPEATAISSASCKRLKKCIIKARKHLTA